jgi:hypothetical protein
VDSSRAIHEQVLKKAVNPLKIVAVFEPSENSCRSSEKSGHFSEKKKWFVWTCLNQLDPRKQQSS